GDPSAAAGGRGGAADVTGDGGPDVATAAGAGGGWARASDPRPGMRVAAFAPCGKHFHDGVFAAGSGRGLRLPDPGPEVKVEASRTDIPEGNTSEVTFTFTRTGDTSAALSVSYAVGGTATSPQDYTFNPPPTNPLV